MLVLGLETSTSRSSVALVDVDRVIASASLGIPRRHGEFLAPAAVAATDTALPRRIEVRAYGAGWERRGDALAAACAPWR